MDMMSFAPEEFVGGPHLCSLIDRYIHRSRIFMHYTIRTAFYRMQKEIYGVKEKGIKFSEHNSIINNVYLVHIVCLMAI